MLYSRMGIDAILNFYHYTESGGLPNLEAEMLKQILFLYFIRMKKQIILNQVIESKGSLFNE